MKKKFIRLVCTALSCACLASCGLKKNDGAVDSTEGIGRQTGQTDTDKSSIPTQTEAPKDKNVRLSLAFAGDNIIHESIFVEAASKATAMASSEGYQGKYYFDSMYSPEVCSLISAADISFVNQEAPITGLRASGYPAFNAPVEIGDTLIKMGFDIVNVANNHMLDMEGQTEGYAKTIEYWKTKNIFQIGGYENQSDYEKIRIMEKNGVKIALLSFTYGTNGNRLNKNSHAVVPLIDDGVIKSRIAEAKSQADAVIVSMHWGDENQLSANSEQKRLAKLIADCGADAVIGHHSHTVQPIEWVTGESGKKTLVIYSLGNFISTQLNSVNLVGNIVTFELVKEERMPVYIENVMSHPTVTHYSADAGVIDSQGLATRSDVKVYLMESYSAALCSAHGSQICGSPFDMNTLKGYITKTLKSEFLPDFLK